MLSDSYLRVPLDQIRVNRDERQRRQLTTEDLEPSIAARGVIQPIIVTRELVLVAGERRLEASKRVGLADIPVRFTDELSSTEAQIIELEENIKRRDLEWQDLVRATNRIHQLYLDLDPDWTQTKTSQALGLADHTLVGIYLKISRKLDDPRIAEARTVREAYNIINRREDRALGGILEDLLSTEEIPVQISSSEAEPEPGTEAGTLIYSSPALDRIKPPPPKSKDSILVTSFIDWIKTYSGPRFNLIHCDFPYGIGHFSSPQARESESQFYDDSPEVYTSLIEALCQNLDKIMSLSGHLLFWYSDKNWPLTREMFSQLAPSLVWQPFPLIWVKSDNVGIASDPQHGPRHIYETCAMATRGDRKIVQIVADAYSCPTDKRLHPSCKPEPMLRHFMSMLTDSHSRVFDPTAGSGTALRAAESLGAELVLGLELDPQVADLANKAFSEFRRKRLASDQMENLV